MALFLGQDYLLEIPINYQLDGCVPTDGYATFASLLDAVAVVDGGAPCPPVLGRLLTREVMLAASPRFAAVARDVSRSPIF